MNGVELSETMGWRSGIWLSRHEVELLEAQLSRDVARMDDELLETREENSLLAKQIEELRSIGVRLRSCLDECGPARDPV